MPAGRPLLFKTPEELEEKIQAYYEECKKNTIEIVTKEGQVVTVSKPLIPTIAGLAYSIGVDRHTITNYEKKQEFFATIKKHRDYIMERLERAMMNGEGSTAGAIFIAKNYGYKDRQERIVDVGGSLAKMLSDDIYGTED